MTPRNGCAAAGVVMKQELQQPVQAGDPVRVRGEDWDVAEVAPGDRCVAVTLIGAGTGNRGRRRVLLAPFDRLQRLPARRLPRHVSYRTWLHAARTLLTTTGPADRLRAAAAAGILLLPYQLEPALAAVRGLATRFLLADAVGLGKTIQAGLLLAELRVRGLAVRSLVLTPPGLRDQWVDELWQRFQIAATVIDRPFVRNARDRFALDVNPWQLPAVAVASLDYVKRPDVRPSVVSLPWDLLIIDEAHGVAPGTDRAALVDALAVRSRRVVLLTATPHAGDPAAFAHLCGIGALDEGPVLLFRRTRRDVGLETRRHTTLLRVAPTAAERRMHRLLARYTAIVWAGAPAARRSDALLVLAILNKRALSSAHSLEQSLARRLALLERDADDDDGFSQLAFGFDAGEADAEDEAPRGLGRRALSDGAREIRHLRALQAAAAAAAAAGESKVAALRRLLRRVAEPVLVFTEYRDTLQWVAERLAPEPVAVLHGGLARQERLAAAEQFSAGAVRLLLATDAAGEGLNLQARCRLLVNLELPWTPRRLEQRIGRVDRLGQRRPVHALHLLARDTGEARVLARLVRRLARIRRALGDGADTTGFPSDADLLGAMSCGQVLAEPGAPAAAMPAASTDAGAPENAAAGILRVDLRAEAAAEATRLDRQRRITQGAVPAGRLSAAGAAHDRAAFDRRWPWFAAAPAGRLRNFRDPGLLLLCRYRVLTGTGSLLEEDLLPVWLPIDSGGGRPTGRELRGLVARALHERGATIQPAIDRLAAGRLDVLRVSHGGAIGRAAGRDRAIAAHADAVTALSAHLVQQGLFDRRAVRDAERQLRRQAMDRDEQTQRQAALDADCRLHLAAPPEPVLILFVPGCRPVRS